MLMIFVELCGGLGLFIAGMNMMSRGIEKVAGDRLRDMLKRLTTNRFLGLIVGLFFTAVIQSSSAATVMTVTFVNSGLMTLLEASGIILGANIGTTVTALLVAFKLSAVAPIFVFVGAILCNYVKNPTARKSGDIVMGFGILFLGISMMSGAMAELREIPEVIQFFANFTNPFLAVLLGLAITSVVQSSSVTVSILVVMASQNLVDLHICMFVILGCNIGACTSAMLASLGGTKNAKRTAWIHLLFNIFGTVLMFVILLVASDVVENIIHFFAGTGSDSASLGRNIAVAHLTFKVFQVIVFYPFMNWIIKLTYLIVPGEDGEEEESAFVLKYIGKTLPNPAVAAYLAVQEMERMAHMALDNLDLAMEALNEQDMKKCEKVFEMEKYIDFLNEQISDYLVKINQNTLPIGDANMISAYFHVVNDIERVGDHAEDVAELAVQMVGNHVEFSQQSLGELAEMMEMVNKMLKESIDMFVTGNTENMQEISDLEDGIDEMERTLLDMHIQRLNQGICSAQAGVYFSDILSGLERVGDHAINIAFSLVEAKESLKTSNIKYSLK
ncbi:MAG: Na/Pi cotransporter family protein [Lachnospiraceae bacterium]|nr:Na/Pi cotransporter family protein [Lachnospiraceae bacterium]